MFVRLIVFAVNVCVAHNTTTDAELVPAVVTLTSRQEPKVAISLPASLNVKAVAHPATMTTSSVLYAIYVSVSQS